MVDYVKLASTAKGLIENFGKNWTHSSVTYGPYDPANNTRSVTSTTDTTVKGAVIGFTRRHLDVLDVQIGDMRLIIEAESLSGSVSVHDKMVEGSDIYQIINAEEIKPADTPVYYDLQLRGGN